VGAMERLIKARTATGGGRSQQDSVPAIVYRGRDVAAGCVAGPAQQGAGDRTASRPDRLYDPLDVHGSIGG
jgi:hypothetical protein